MNGSAVNKGNPGLAAALRVLKRLQEKHQGVIEASDAPEQVTKVTLLEARGRINLYKVETNLGSHKVAAPSEAAARATIESELKEKASLT